MTPQYLVRCFFGFAELPPAYGSLLEGEIARQGFFREPQWFEYLLRHYFASGDELRLYGLEDAATGRPLLLAPLRHSQADYAVRGGQVLGSLSHPENYATAALIFDPAVHDYRPLLGALFKRLREAGSMESGHRPDAIRIWPFDRHAALGHALLAALREAGYIVQTYENSFNRFEDTAGLDYATYFARRSANMRYNVRRRQRALEKQGRLEMRLITEPEDLAAAIPDYIAVSRASWKSPASMYSLETLGLIQLCAAKGCLRLGILRIDGVAAATQFWILSGGTAHCARLAYDEGYKKLAVGVVLTNFMIAHLLDRDHVGRLDYGYGRDEYKRGWMKDAREYFGIIAFNPSTWRGRAYGLRHVQGRRLKRAVKGVLERLGWKRPATGDDEVA